MPAKIEIELKGEEELKGLFRELEKLGISNQPLFAEIGLFMNAQIKQRTARGIDANEQTFKPYSPRYKAKRMSMGLPTDHVDLFFTGSMLSSMMATDTQDEVRVFFAPTQDKFGGSNPAKAFFINEGQDREFFAISEKEADTILNLAAIKLTTLLETAGK